MTSLLCGIENYNKLVNIIKKRNRLIDINKKLMVASVGNDGGRDNIE